jgi:hypothetical protein
MSREIWMEISLFCLLVTSRFRISPEVALIRGKGTSFDRSGSHWIISGKRWDELIEVWL